MNNIDMNKLYNQICTLINRDNDSNKQIKFIHNTGYITIQKSISSYINIYEDTNITDSDIISIVKINKVPTSIESFNVYIASRTVPSHSNHFITNTEVPIEIFYHFISDNFLPLSSDPLLIPQLCDNDMLRLYLSVQYIISEKMNINKQPAYTTIKNKSIIQQYFYIIPDFIMIRSLDEVFYNSSISYLEYMDMMKRNSNKTLITKDMYDAIKVLYKDSSNNLTDMNNMIIISKIIKEG